MTGHSWIMKTEDYWAAEGGKDRLSCERNCIKGAMTRLFKGPGNDWQTFKEE